MTSDTPVAPARLAAWAIIALLAIGSCQPAAAPVTVTPARYAVTGSADDDTAEIQAAIDRGPVLLPAGTFSVSSLHGNVSITGAGRGETIIEAHGDGPILTVTGTTKVSDYELEYGPHIEGITFTGPGTCLHFEAVGYFEVAASAFRHCGVGIEYAGALQGRIDDTAFTDNGTGVLYRPAQVDYFERVIPPSRVTITWSGFYRNETAVDYAGGQQIIIRDTEFGVNGTAISVEASGGLGLVASGLWMEADERGIVLRGPASHAIRDSWLAYGDTIDEDGGTLICENVRYDAAVASDC